jgi:peptidoglycan/LPS O-acetylase OafA/YrhL
VTRETWIPFSSGRQSFGGYDSRGWDVLSCTGIHLTAPTLADRVALWIENMKPIQALTSVRALLAFWVVTRHMFTEYDGVTFFHIAHGISVFQKGYLGVDGFFILSGFILAYNYAKGKSYNFQDFIAARFARVYPIHFVCLFSAALIMLVKQYLLHKVVIGTPGNTYTMLLLNVLLLNSWTFQNLTGWNDVAWSVSSEWFAYVFFPIFVSLARPTTRIGSLVLLMIPAAALALVEWHSPRHLSLPGGLVRLIPEFYVGVVLYRLREQIGVRGLQFGSLLALSLMAIGLHAGVDTIVVAGLAALILALSFENDTLHTALSIRPLVYLGEISYCAYMVQRFPQSAMMAARRSTQAIAALPEVVQIVLFVGLVLLCAATLHHVIENPMRSALKSLLSRKRKNTGDTLVSRHPIVDVSVPRRSTDLS